MRTIIFQQLSGKAAATIHARFLELFPQRYPDAKRLLDLDEQTLRDVGLSRQKGGYLRNVAKYWSDERLHTIDWKRSNDEEILALLTPIKSLGISSVQMLLMLTLQRPDVFPLGDLGVRNAIIKKYRLRSTGKNLDNRITQIATRWSPYRTLASLYLGSWQDDQ